MSSVPNPETAAASNGHWFTRQHTLTLVLVVATVSVFVLCFLIVQPFLAPIAWALALAIIAMPIHLWIESRVRNVNIAAILSVAAVVLILFVPTMFVLHQLVREASGALRFFDDPEKLSQWRETLKGTKYGETVLWIDDRVNLTSQAERLAGELAGFAPDLVRGSVWLIAHILIMIFTLYYLFRDHRYLADTVRSLVPLSHAEASDVFRIMKDTIYATIYGSVMMGLLQGFLGGLIFWWLGLPAPMLWGVVMAIVATVPNLGAFVIWGPAVIGLALQDDWYRATILGVYGLIAISLIDNLLYPIVVGHRMSMHSLPVFFAILGGVLFFGAAGLILGPAIFALMDALIEIWRRRTREGRAAEQGVSPLVTDLTQVKKPAPLIVEGDEHGKVLTAAKSDKG